MLSISDMLGAITAGDGLARPNLFQVILPRISGSNIDLPNLNLLCKNAQLPLRQIITNERVIGSKTEKIAYASASEDVSLTFYVTNDYSVKKYFDAWQDLVINPDTYELNYKVGTNGYGKEVVINQLAKNVKGFISSARFNEFANKKIIYSCILEQAFPTSMNAIELSNEANGLVELNVQLSYTKWKVRSV